MSAVHSLKPKATSGITIGNLRVSIEMMDLATFRALPDSPKQRDHELRAGKHLATLCPEHIVVSVYRDASGAMSKIDGHTRAYTWAKRHIEPPMLWAVIFEEIDDSVDTVTEQYRLYDSHDSRQSVKKSADEIQSALKIHNIALKTDWLRKGGFGNALRIASLYIPIMPRGSSPKDKEQRIRLAMPVLENLDSLAPKPARLKTGFLAGVFLFLAEYGTAGLGTVKSYIDGTNCLEIDSKKNAYARLQELLKLERAAGTMAGDGNNMRQAVRVYELLALAHRDPSVNTRVISFDPNHYADRFKTKKTLAA